MVMVMNGHEHGHDLRITTYSDFDSNSNRNLFFFQRLGIRKSGQR